jgi:hypothetical protein
MTTSNSTIAEISARYLRRGAGAFVLSLLVVLAVAQSAFAHRGDQSYVYLDVGEKSLGGRVEFPVNDVKAAFGIDLLLSGDELIQALDEASPTLRAYAAQHFSIGLDGETWPVTFEGAEMLAWYPKEAQRNYVILPFRVDRKFDSVPRTFAVTFNPFFDEIENRDALLLIGNDWQSGVIDNGEGVFLRYTPGNDTQTVGLDSGAWWKTMGASVKLGVDHIKTGPDHILFIFVLLLPSVLMLGAAGWRAAPTFGSALWRILKIATMFTLAHTITFTLAGLGVLPLPPSKFVEAVIAISIAMAALHNLYPLTKNKEWAIAFGFGLFHGMGFASLVEDLDVSRKTQLISLLGRNVGIEIGQVAVIILAFPALFLLRRTSAYRGVFVVGSVLLSVVSVGWMIERVFEVELGINDFVDPLLDFPRALIPVAILTGLAGAWYVRERRAGRLTGVHEHVPTDPPELVGAS